MACIISKKDVGAPLLLYNMDGFFLNLTTYYFDGFVTSSIGIALSATYRTTKGKTLVVY